MSAEDTITREELAAYCGRLARDRGSYLSADEIWKDIQDCREPEYEPGAIYQDPAGRAWFRVRRDDLSGASWRCCESGSIYSHDVPERPLLKMTAGSAVRLPVSRSEVIDTLSDERSG